MKRLLQTLLVGMICIASARAQYVTVPDPNFVTWLQNNGYATCLSGNQLDTTCPAVVNATTVACTTAFISDLTGIQYFDNLTNLECQNNQLTSLPMLPSTLTKLKCNSNDLSSLPVLPLGLTELFCHNNLLTGLPILPDSLKELNCGGNDLGAAFASSFILPPLLEDLYCSGAQLYALPSLPPTLKRLDVKNNNFVVLPDLPNSLTKLICTYNDLTSLPILPDAIYDLQCDQNQLTALPDLPDSLYNLECGENQLTFLPLLPAGLHFLKCSQNQIASFPPFPSELVVLHCWNNQLVSLPDLPATLVVISADDNLLTSLPPLSQTVLEDLYCQHNQLTSLPELPASLKKLVVEDNQLTEIPALPSVLTHLWVQHNQLTSLPPLPSVLNQFVVGYNPNLTCMPPLEKFTGVFFDIQGTGITCLPNVIEHTANLPQIDTMPICGIFGNGCEVAWNVAGKIFRDANADCLGSTSEPNLQNLKLQLFQGGVLQQQVYSNFAGDYSFDVSLGTFEVKVDTTDIPFNVICPINNLYPTTLAPIDSLDYTADFALVCKPGYDLSVNAVAHTNGMFFPAQIATVTILAGDLVQFYGADCNTAGLSGTVTATITGPANLANVSGSGSISGNTVTWAVSDFATASDYVLWFVTDSFPQQGSQVCIEATIAATGGIDSNPLNNTLSQCFAVVNSFDPNFKEVYPRSWSDPGSWHTYTVHFQNTGTAAAQHILVIDTLDANLDWASFQLLAYSHGNLTQVLENGIVHFNFPNINLPDSTSDEPNSHGWVQYRIKTDSTIAPGTTVHNTAGIYFDFNDPVITNDALVSNCAPIQQQQDLTICEGDSVNLGGQWLQQAGIYTHAFVTLQGCDSVVTTTLNVTPFTLSVNVSANTMTASGGTTYQWIDCATNLPIAGASASSYTATQNGSYAAQITDANGCSGLTECVEITVLGLGTLSLNTFDVYPSPANAVAYIELKAINELTRVELTDLAGRVLISITPDVNNVMLPLNDYLPGFYVVKIIENNSVLGVKQLSIVR